MVNVMIFGFVDTYIAYSRADQMVITVVQHSLVFRVLRTIDQAAFPTMMSSRSEGEV